MAAPPPLGRCVPATNPTIADDASTGHAQNYRGGRECRISVASPPQPAPRGRGRPNLRPCRLHCNRAPSHPSKGCPMMNLAKYNRTFNRLADFLPWAALVDEGIVLNKDGSFQRTARFRGPDLDSAVPAELVGVAGRLNNALRRLGSGWAVFVEAERHPASKYPEGSFPDVASALVDVERRAQFEQEGAHFESSHFLTFLYLPPPGEARRAER